MKKCPSCNRTYTDDALSFCLEDGSPLLSVGGGSSDQTPSFDPNATLQYNPARDTNPPPTQVYNPTQPPGQQPPPQYTPMPTPSWSPSPGPAQPKKSKAIYWILGSVAALVIVGIVGVVLLVVLVGSNLNANNSNNSNNSNAKNSNRNSNSNNSNATASNKNSSTTSDSDYQLQDDFSSANWWAGSNSYGSAEYVNGEYQMTAASSTGWVVVYGPPDNPKYHTEHATTRVTARSVSGTSPAQGYGLTVYGLLKNGNLEDYGFLIRTDESPAFRIVLHQGGKESVMINWTRSSLIRTGSAPNQLEVRANEDQLSFYINGQFAQSVTDKANYRNGVVGFYTSDIEPVAFDDLEIFK